MDERISKLPKWAQEHIETLDRERGTALEALNDWLDKQSESPIYYEDLLSTGENKGPTFKKVYIQTRKITINHAGIELEIILRDNSIALSYRGPNLSLKDIALIPSSYQNFRLVSKENMR